MDNSIVTVSFVIPGNARQPPNDAVPRQQQQESENEKAISIPNALVPVAVPPDDLLQHGSFKEFMAFQLQHMKTMENSLKSVVQEQKKSKKEIEEIKKDLNLNKALSMQLLQKAGVEKKLLELKDSGLSEVEILQEMTKELDKIPDDRRQNFEEEVHASIPNSTGWSWKRILLAACTVIMRFLCMIAPGLSAVV